MHTHIHRLTCSSTSRYWATYGTPYLCHLLRFLLNLLVDGQCCWVYGKRLDFGLVRDTSSRCSASSLLPAKRLDVPTTPHTASQLMHYYTLNPGVCAAVVAEQTTGECSNWNGIQPGTLLCPYSNSWHAWRAPPPWPAHCNAHA